MLANSFLDVSTPAITVDGPRLLAREGPCLYELLLAFSAGGVVTAGAEKGRRPSEELSGSQTPHLSTYNGRAIGLAASVIAVSQTAWAVAKGLYDLADEVGEARPNLRQ